MTRIIVTAGGLRADVDVLACAVAYAELLRLEGNNALAVVGPEFTASITPSVLAYGGAYTTSYESQEGDQFVMVDISDPAHFASFVDQARIREIYDHHFFGHEVGWQALLGPRCHIEHVGACATLIWEEVVQRGLAETLSLSSKKLLAAAIVSNSLNFRAAVTDERDKRAYESLRAEIGYVNDEWIADYFRLRFENTPSAAIISQLRASKLRSRQTS